MSLLSEVRKMHADMLACCEATQTKLDALKQQVADLEKKLLQVPPPDPGPITGTFSQTEDGMKLDLTLPNFNPDTDDIFDRQVTTSIDGTQTNQEKIGADPANLSYTVSGLTQGQKVRVELVNLDDGSPPNVSANPSVFEGTANVSGTADTVAPGDPGAMTGTFSEG